MSVSDFFKPIWKNSSPEVRIKHLLQISQTEKYKQDHPQILKIIKKVAVDDPDEKIKVQALKLLKEPEHLKEVIAEAKSASIKSWMIKEIEKIFLEKKENISVRKQQFFLNLFKDESLIKDMIFREPQLFLNGIEKINHQDILTEVFIFSIPHQNETDLGYLVDKINHYSNLKSILKKYQNSNYSPTLFQKIIDKFTSLPEYQEDLEILEDKKKWEDFHTTLSESICSFKERLHQKNFSSDIIHGPDYFSQPWKFLSYAYLINKDSVEVFKKKIEEFKSLFNKWQEEKERYNYCHDRASKLVHITENFESLLTNPEESQIGWSEEKIDEYITQIQDQSQVFFKQAEDLIESLPEEVYASPIMVHSRDEYISKKNQFFTNLQETKEHLFKRGESFTNLQQHIHNIKGLLENFDEEKSLDYLKNTLADHKNQWDEMWNHITPPTEQLLQDQDKEFKRLFSQCSQKVDERIQRQVIQHKQFIANLNQEVKNKAEALRVLLKELNEGLLTNFRNLHKAKEQQEKLKEFLKSITPYQDKLDSEEITHYRKQLEELHKKTQEIEENYNREQSINIEKKKKICSVLEEVSGSENKEKLVELVKEAQIKWTKIGHVAKKDFIELNQKFNEICQKLLSDCQETVQLVEEKIQKQIEHKKKLISQVDDLYSQSANFQESDWRKAKTDIQNIIQKWKEIKILSEKDNRELNLDFKNQLDNFYQSLDKYYNQLKVIRNEKLQQKKSLLEKMTLSILSHSNNQSKKDGSPKQNKLDWSILKKELFHFLGLWKKIGVAYPFSENKVLDQEFKNLIEDALTKQGMGEDIRRQQKEKLWTEFTAIEESLTENQDPTFVQEQVKQIFHINNEWNKIFPILSKKYRKSNSEFHSRYKKILTEKHSAVEEINKDKKSNLEKKQKLLQQLEELLYQEPQPETSKKVIEIQKQWKVIGPISSKLYSKVEKPFYQMISNFFKQKRSDYKKIKEERESNYKKKLEILTRIRYLLLGKKQSEDFQNLVDSPENLKIIWEMNRKLNSYGEKNQDKRIREEVRNLKNQWKLIGPTFTDKKLNDEFYDLIRKNKF